MLALGRFLLGGRGKKDDAKLEGRIDVEKLQQNTELGGLLDEYRRGVTALAKQEPFTMHGIRVTTLEQLDDALLKVASPHIEGSVSIVAARRTMSRRGAVKALAALAVGGLMAKGGVEVLDSANDAGQQAIHDRMKDTFKRSEVALGKLNTWQGEVVGLSGKLWNEFEEFMEKLVESILQRKGEAARAVIEGMAEDIGDFLNNQDVTPDKLKQRVQEFINRDPALQKEYGDVEKSLGAFKSKIGELDGIKKEFGDLVDIGKQGDAFKDDFKKRFIESLRKKNPLN